MMVYAFLLQDVGKRDDINTLVYSEVFGAGLNLDVPLNEQRSVRKQQLTNIAARVNSEFRFKRVCFMESMATDVTNTDRLAQAMEAGVFRLSAGKPLPEEKHVIWQVIDGCCFVLVLAPTENKSLAENVLSLIVRYLLQIFKSFDSCDEMVTNPDKIASVLHTFLPNGQLVVMNRRVVKQLEKDLFRILSENK